MAQLPTEQVSDSFEVEIDSDTTGRNAGNADNVDVNNVEEEELGEGETTEEGSSNQQDRREHYREAMFGDGRGRGAGRGGRYGFFDRGGLGSFGGRGGGLGSFGGRRGGGCGGFVGEFSEVQADEFEDPRMEFDGVRCRGGGSGPFGSQGFDDDFYADPRIGFGGFRGGGGHGGERGGVFHGFNRQFDYFARPCMAHTPTEAGVNENASKNKDDKEEEKTQKPAEDDAPPCTCDVSGSNMYTGPRRGRSGFMRGRGGFGNPRMQFVFRGGWRGAGMPYARPHRFPGHHNDLPSMTIGISIPLTRPPFQSHSFGGCCGPRPPFRPEHGLVW